MKRIYICLGVLHELNLHKLALDNVSTFIFVYLNTGMICVFILGSQKGYGIIYNVVLVTCMNLCHIFINNCELLW